MAKRKERIARQKAAMFGKIYGDQQYSFDIETGPGKIAVRTPTGRWHTAELPLPGPHWSGKSIGYRARAIQAHLDAGGSIAILDIEGMGERIRKNLEEYLKISIDTPQ